MKAEQVDQALRQKFVGEDQRLVFWHDPNGEFTEYVTAGFSGELGDVQVLDVNALGGFPAKLRLERDDPTGKYLVYTTGQLPPADEDWLLDIRIYSDQFHADVASLWLQELGIGSLSLRDHLTARTLFLRSQDRRKKLAKIIDGSDDEATIDRKMLAVLVGSPAAGIYDILRAICNGHLVNGEFDLSETPEVIATFEKMDLLQRFWKCVEVEFHYVAEQPSVAGLLRRLFVSELIHQTDGTGMGSLAHHELPTAGRQNAAVFLAQWRDSSANAESYDAVAYAVASEQNAAEAVRGLDLQASRAVHTFWEAERQVVSNLKEYVLAETVALDVGLVAEVASERKAGYWLSGRSTESAEKKAMARAYDAIAAASELFALEKKAQAAMKFDTPAECIEAYTGTLYRFDFLYRQFHTYAAPAAKLGWDLLKALSQRVEAVYDQGFLQPFGVAWSGFLDAGFLDEWHLAQVPSQQGFFSRELKRHLDKSDRKRAFVIISDAFRYEAARQLTDTLCGLYRMDAEIRPMLGVLPSYTALGMASLLPHETLAYTDKGEVLVDGKSAAGTEARNRQLSTVDGMACQASDFLRMTTSQLRELTQNKRVVYVYHNVIDARGDSASTEGETFDAVSDCIDELAELTQLVVNKLNASKVWVTADHGFLYQQDAPGETDKSKLSYKPEKAVISKKRYVIGPGLGSTAEAHHGVIKNTAGADGAMEFWVPRAANRFHFTGGARFVHGGAMPQEVVVPLVTVTQLRGKKQEKSRSEKVKVQVLGAQHKITTPQHRFEFIQTEPVGDRRKPLSVRAAIYDGANPVTTVETVTFESDSQNMDERKKSIRLALGSGSYDRKKDYRLVLRDAETEAEVLTVPVVIDRSFDDDF